MDESTSWPAEGDTFYWIRSDTGDICESTYIHRKASVRFRESIGNMYRSIADAEEAVAILQAKEQDRRRAMK